jgi:hypothetical protein
MDTRPFPLTGEVQEDGDDQTRAVSNTMPALLMVPPGGTCEPPLPQPTIFTQKNAGTHEATSGNTYDFMYCEITVGICASYYNPETKTTRQKASWLGV